MVFIYYLKMQDGHSMIAEASGGPHKPTHIIIPQAEESEQMVGMMNKNLSASLFHMLMDLDFPLPQGHCSTTYQEILQSINRLSSSSM